MHFNLQVSTACVVFGQMLQCFYWTAECYCIKMPFTISFNIALPLFSLCPLYPDPIYSHLCFTVEFFPVFFVLVSILFLVIPHHLYTLFLNLSFLFPCVQVIHLSTVHWIARLNFHSSLIPSLMFVSSAFCILLLFCLFYSVISCPGFINSFLHKVQQPKEKIEIFQWCNWKD